MSTSIADFFFLLTNEDISFLRNAMLAAIFSAVPCGLIGSFIVVKRISYITGALSHSLLAGIGLSLFLGRYNISFTPTVGMFIVAILASLVITHHGKQRDDTKLSLLWSLGMGIGILLISRVPQYIDVSSYLFGSILLIGQQELYMVGGLAIFVCLLIILCYRRFIALAFDEEYLHTRCKHVHVYRYIFFLTIGVSIASLVALVGILLLIALLTLPAASCLLVCRNVRHAIIASVPLTMCIGCLGIFVSYLFDLPSGACIVVIAGLIYILCSLLRALRRN